MSSFYDNIINQREKIHSLNNVNVNARYTCAVNENSGSSYYYGFPYIDSHSLLENELECLDRLEDCIIPILDKLEPVIKKAECINPVGLTIKCIDTKDAMDVTMPKCDVNTISALKSSDSEKINNCIEKISDPTEFFSDSLLDMKMCSLNTVKESCGDKKASRIDIEESIKTIKNSKKKLHSLKDNAHNKSQSKKYKVNNLKEEMDKAARVVLHDDEEKEKCTKVSECCLAAAFIENEDLQNYISAVKERTQFLSEMSIAINTITRASMYNPRDIKNTLLLSEMSGDMVSYNFNIMVLEQVDYIEEANHLFGIKVDRKRLTDPKYTEDLIKQIKAQPKEEFESRDGARWGMLTVSMCVLTIASLTLTSCPAISILCSLTSMVFTSIASTICAYNTKSKELTALQMQLSRALSNVNRQISKCKDPSDRKKLEKSLAELEKVDKKLSEEIKKAKIAEIKGK